MNASQNNGLLSTLTEGTMGGVGGSDGPGPEMEDGGSRGHHHGHHHGHGHQSSSFCPCLQLFAGARALHKARSKRGSLNRGNVFDHGLWRNCVEFWSDPTEGGSGAFNYYELYHVDHLTYQKNSSLNTFQQTMNV